MPAFALFYPVEVAIAATAIVHLANNIFKAGLVGRKANLGIVVRFALPAAIMAMVGALLLNYFTTVEPVTQYTLAGRDCTVTVVKLVIAVMIMGFAFIELNPNFEKLAFNTRFIPLGGALSGFFGGLSGHQGALRTAFLIRTGLCNLEKPGWHRTHRGGISGGVYRCVYWFQNPQENHHAHHSDPGGRYAASPVNCLRGWADMKAYMKKL